MKKNKMLIGITSVLLILGGIFLLVREKTNSSRITYPEFAGPPRKTEGLTVVPTMQDKITNNSAWCATFQLIWNDLLDEVVKQDVVFNPQLSMVTNLNKKEFTTKMLSDDYYYKKYGLKTLALKEEIEKAIKNKFNQESDILDSFDWSEEALHDSNNPFTDRYFFYVMLYRNFEYLKEFEKIEKGTFNKYKDIAYFGIDKNSNYEVRSQIEVLFYNSDNDFAILINTKTDDEVIFYKNPKGENFKEIYNNMNDEVHNYTGNKTLTSSDKFKAPNLQFNELREYDELANKPFNTVDGQGEIVKAVQTIQFYLNEKGGEIKSEAGMDVNLTSIGPDEIPSRNFYIDDTFVIFLREKGKDLPYFASKVTDINKFQ